MGINRVLAVGLVFFGVIVFTSCGSSTDEGLSSRLSSVERQALEARCDEAQTRAVKAHKIAICHIPPGNPANAHTIVVSRNAETAHLAHGDVLGACDCDLIDHPGGDGSDGPGNSGGNGNGNKNGGPHDPADDDGDSSGGSDTDYTPAGAGDDDGDGEDGEDDGASGSGSGSDDTTGDSDDSSSGGGSGSDGGGGAYGVCDPDQFTCSAPAECPSNNTCDLGCCVYVIL